MYEVVYCECLGVFYFMDNIEFIFIGIGLMWLNLLFILSVFYVFLNSSLICDLFISGISVIVVGNGLIKIEIGY